MLIKNQSYNLNPIKQIKKLVIMLSIAGIPMAGCSKDENNEPEPQHDTTYLWGAKGWEKIYPTTNVKASADSIQVRNVILECDDNEWGGWSTTTLRKDLLEPIFNLSPKIKGAGTLNNVQVSKPEHKVDSIWLAKQGYTFGKMYQKQK